MSEPLKQQPKSDGKPRVTEFRTIQALHLGTDVGSHWLLGRSKSGNSAISGIEMGSFGLLVRFSPRSGAGGKALMVPWSNIAFCAVEE